MDTLSASLKTNMPLLSLEQLHNLKGIIEARIDILETKAIHSDIKSEVEKHGFWIGNLGEVPGLSTIRLRFNVIVFTWDKEDYTDPKVSRLDDKQPEWVKRLRFSPDSPVDESRVDWDSIGKGDWDWDAHDNPARATTTASVDIYYRQGPCPPGKFQSINEEGWIQDWENRSGTLYCEGERIDAVSAWNDYEVFVVPPERPLSSI